MNKEIEDMYLDCDKNDLHIIGLGTKEHEEAYMKLFDMACENAVKSKDGINPNKPKHYDIGIDTFTRMRANANFEEAMGFIRWNIDKYNTRAKGQDEEDYKKIEAYCKEARWWFVNKRAKD